MRHGCCARRCSVFQLVQKTITRRSSKNLLISSQKLLLRRSLCFCDQLTKAFYLQEIPLQYFIPLSVKLKLSTDKKLLSAPIHKHQAACWSSSISLTHRKLSERTHPHPPQVLPYHHEFDGTTWSSNTAPIQMLSRRVLLTRSYLSPQ